MVGAVIGPVALAWGLQRTSGASASLMLTLEAVFTAVLARLWYHETLDRRVTLAMALLTLGGMLLQYWLERRRQRPAAKGKGAGKKAAPPKRKEEAPPPPEDKKSWWQRLRQAG